jgi:hypothetical protein
MITLAGLGVNFLNHLSVRRVRSYNWLTERNCHLSNVLNFNKKANYLVQRASWHDNLLARQPDLVVLGKRTVLSVDP